MTKRFVFVSSLIVGLLFNQNYQNILKKFSDRLVTIDFDISFEVRGEVIKRTGKTVGIIYDDSKVLTTSITFEDELTYSKRLRLISMGQNVGFTNYKAPKTVKILYNKKEISAELLLSNFDKGIAVVKAQKETFPFKPLKFSQKNLKVADNVTILSILPVETFGFPTQLINCSISAELKKQDNRFYHCDKPIGHIAGGIVFNSNSDPIGILTTPISIPESMYDEKDNFMISYYGLNSVVVLPYIEFKSFLGEDEQKSSKLWIGLIPGTFSLYYDDKLKNVIKDNKYKMAINIDKVVPDGSLQDSKIFENDLIVEINGEKIENMSVKSETDVLVKITSLLKPLEFITLKIYRKSEDKYLDIKVVPKEQPVFWDQMQETAIDELGIKVKDLTVDYKLKRKLDVSEKGVAVTGGVNVQKDATNKSFVLYDIIKKVEKNQITDIKSLKDIISRVKSDGKKTVSIEVIRSEENEIWNLKIELR